MPGPSSVERVLARMRERGDFPAMAGTVGQISKLTSSEATSTSALAETVLQDYGLAQKLLRLVNTAAFAQRGQVTTISRAVLLLGFERVRSVATGLILFEHLQAQAKTPDLVDTLNMSFYSAILGRTIADGTGFADPEEGFISALFHNLGRILVALYLPDELALIKASDDQDRDAAVHSVLGQSYTALGIAVADSLNLPGKLAGSMAHIAGSRSHQSMTDEEKLACLATLANGITDALAAPTEAKDKRGAIERLIRSYGVHFAAIDGKLDALIGSAVVELKAHSKTFNLDLPGSAFVHGLGEWRIESLVANGGTGGIAAASAAGGLIEIPESDLAADEVPETVLTRGLHEITSLLVTGSFERRGRSVHAGHASAQGRRDQEHFRGRGERAGAGLVPTAVVAGRYVVLLPLVVDQKALGLFYIDGDAAGTRLLTPALLNYLKVLRGQATVAIRQKSARPDARRK